MQSAVIVGGQVLAMALLTIVGIFSKKKGMINDPAARCMSTFLLNVAMPCVMISSLYREKKPELMEGLGMALLLGTLMYGLSIALSRLLIKKRGGEEYHAERFSVVYANSIYMGMPMIRAALGEDSAFYAIALVVVFMVLFCTHGMRELGGKSNLAGLLKNPCVISAPIGLLLFWFQIPLPGPVTSVIGSLAGLTTPLSMIIAGVFLAELKPSDLRGRYMYQAALLRTVVIPLAVIALLAATGFAGWFPEGRNVALATVYSFACPSAVAIILACASLGKDAFYACKLVAVSTIMSLATMPVVAAIGDMVI